MNATDILDSKYYLDSAFVAQEANPPFFSGHRYSSMQLGPDSKIYIMRYGNETILHSINNPNMHEIEANFKGNAIFLPKDNDFELPVFPNYRLGALAGSPCDTLTSNINILQEKLQKTINVYPNPFTDLIRIESKEALNFTFQIYDAIGMKVYDQSIQSFQNKQELNVKSLKEGIYYYHILSDYQKLKSGKLIKI